LVDESTPHSNDLAFPTVPHIFPSTYWYLNTITFHPTSTQSILTSIKLFKLSQATNKQSTIHTFFVLRSTLVRYFIYLDL
jgi:hypothetical protein